MAAKPPKLSAPAVAADITPHRSMAVGRYKAGFPVLFRIRFEGICRSKYPAERILKHVEY